MRIAILSALAAGLLMGASALTPAGAAPAAPGAIATPESGVEQVRHTRRHRAYQRRMMKRRAMRRGASRMYAPSQAGNARNPERPVYQQGQGGTTGGPRY